MIKPFLLTLFLLSPFTVHAKPELRCGWWWSTPGDTSLTDRDGQWNVRQQGGYEAKARKGVEIAIKNTSVEYYQPIQGSSARACVCLKADFDPKTHRSSNLERLTQKKISDCEKKGKTIFPADYIVAGQTVPETPDEAITRVTLSQTELYVQGMGIFGLEFVKKSGEGFLCKTDSPEKDQKFVFIQKEKGKLSISFRAKESSENLDTFEVPLSK